MFYVVVLCIVWYSKPKSPVWRWLICFTMWVATLSQSLSLIPVYHSTAWCCQDVVTCHWTSIHFCLEGCNDTLQGVRCRSLFIHLIMEFICALTLLLDIARHILRKRWMSSYVISCLNRRVGPPLPRTSSKSGPWMHQATHTYSSQHYTHVHIVSTAWVAFQAVLGTSLCLKLIPEQ